MCIRDRVIIAPKTKQPAVQKKPIPKNEPLPKKVVKSETKVIVGMGDHTPSFLTRKIPKFPAK